MTKKKKFYAVRKGVKIGIYETWLECEKQISGYSGSEYKAFNSISEANTYLGNNCEKEDSSEIDDEELNYQELVNKDLENNYVVAFTDGSHNINTKISSYGIHLTIPNGKGLYTEEEVSSRVKTSRFEGSNNIIGEVFGVINALEWCLKNDIDKISIYCDYEGLIKWGNNEWKTKSDISKYYYSKLSEYKVMLDVKFTWVRGHSNIRQNENADILAKNALEGKKTKFKTGRNYFTGDVNNLQEIDSIVTRMKEIIDFEVTVNDVENGVKKTLEYEKEKLHVTYYTKNRRLLVQGNPGYLYSMFLSYYSETLEVFNLVRTYSNAFESTIDNSYVEREINKMNLPSNYPNSYKTLIRQAISSLKIKNQDEYDYGHYTVPAYRALEGNLRYLCEEAGHHIDEIFSIGHKFNKDDEGRYYLTHKKLVSHKFKDKIEACYNLYFYQRHPILHTGEMGLIDNTRLLSNIDDAKSEIKQVLALLSY